MDYQKLCKEQQPVIDKIMDLFTERKIEPKTGEAVLCMLAGMSVGLRAGSLTQEMDGALQALAAGFTIAAKEG